MDTVVIRNKGIRTYRLPDGPGGVRRELAPSRTMEVSADEAKQHLNYTDIEDASADVLPQQARALEGLREENARLKAQHDRLLAANKETPATAPAQSELPEAFVPTPRQRRARRAQP